MTARNVLKVLGFAAAVAVLGVVGARAVASLPAAGHVPHPYGHAAVLGGFEHDTASAVMSVTLDQRGFDTMGEEFMLFAAAVGTVLLLRHTADDQEQAEGRTYGSEDVFDAVRLTGYLLLPVVLVVGVDLVLHGHLSPGGGFQGGAVLATGLHLAYLAGDQAALDRLRPPGLFDTLESLGAGCFVLVGLTGLAAGGFLDNWVHWPRVGDIATAGVVPVLNLAIGVEVGAAFVLIVAKFLEQALTVRPEE